MDLSAIGQQFGLSPQQTQSAVEALGPVIAAGMRRNASAGGGGLGDILGGMLAGGGAVDPTSTGNDILGQIFGSKDVSRGVANQVSAQTGIGAAVIKKLLPVLATFVLAQLASGRGGAGGGGLGDILGSVLGGGSAPQQQSGGAGGGLGDILGSVLGGGAGSQSGGGLGDILGSVLGGAAGQQSGAGGGLGDILGQVLGGGQQSHGAGSPADILLEQLQKNLGR